jgi:hypothetical protein
VGLEVGFETYEMRNYNCFFIIKKACRPERMRRALGRMQDLRNKICN